MAELVGIACHDLRTPLATVFGFARTLGRSELAERERRYVEMIEAASEQIGELLEELALVGRIESGRYEPTLAETDTLELARQAAADLSEERVSVSGEGAVVRVDPLPLARALSRLARAAARHGGLDAVELRVRGQTIELSPVTRSAAPVVLGENVRELGAAAAVVVLGAFGASLALEDDRLVVRLPS